MRLIHHFLFSATLPLLAASAPAAYSDKPITLIVPYSAGGPTDRVARDFADALHRTLGGQPIVIDNSAGAGGDIGA
jgi:tripartite-type tricarboxylate transporter receptor subunit TctC